MEVFVMFETTGLEVVNEFAHELKVPVSFTVSNGSRPTQMKLPEAARRQPSHPQRSSFRAGRIPQVGSSKISEGHFVIFLVDVLDTKLRKLDVCVVCHTFRHFVNLARSQVPPVKVVHRERRLWIELLRNFEVY
jgi:hypothetical protein